MTRIISFLLSLGLRRLRAAEPGDPLVILGQGEYARRYTERNP